MSTDEPSTPEPFPDISTFSWETIPTLTFPTARHEACFVAAANGLHYLIGGRRLKPVSIYDPLTQTWTEAPGPGRQIHHMQCVAAPDGKIWIPSSWTGGFPTERAHTVIWIFDTNTNTWSTKPGMAAERLRGGSASVLWGDKIYVSHGNVGGHGEHATSVSWLDVYDIPTETWTALEDGPHPRDHTGGGVVDGRLCVAGGRDGGTKNFFNAVVPETDCYDFSTSEWTTEENIPTPRAGSAYGVACSGELMVAGGEGFKMAFDSFELFDGENWTEGAKLNTARHGTGLAVHSCECGVVTIASGSGRQGGRPELNDTESLVGTGMNVKCR